MIAGDTKLTKFFVKPIDSIVTSALGIPEIFANVRHLEVITIEKDLDTRELSKPAVNTSCTST